MLPQRMKKAVADNPKKLANLIDLVNIPSTLRDFVGQSQISRLGCFTHVWSYIKSNNLQDANNKNLVNCDAKLKQILLGKSQVDLAELPALIKLHFPKAPKSFTTSFNFLLKSLATVLYSSTQ
ncbi:Upstream activation factor subunit UAF30 [Linum grandiflorum]